MKKYVHITKPVYAVRNTCIRRNKFKHNQHDAIPIEKIHNIRFAIRLFNCAGEIEWC